MRTETIEWEETTDGGSAINCPVCGKVWSTSGSSYLDLYTCEHLVFQWGEGGLYPLGEFDEERFKADYLKAKAKVGEDEDHYFAFGSSPQWDVLEALKTRTIDTLLELTERGMACGPVAFTTFFGLRRGKTTRAAKPARKA